MYNFGVAIQIYLLGFVIALAMACIIKLMMLFFSIKGKKSETVDDAVSPSDAEKAQAKRGEGGAS